MAVGHVSISRVNWVLDHIINSPKCRCYFVTKGFNQFELRRNAAILVKSFLNEEELDDFLEDLQRKKLKVKYEKNENGVQIPVFIKDVSIPEKSRQKQGDSKSLELFDSDDSDNTDSSAYFD